MSYRRRRGLGRHRSGEPRTETQGTGKGLGMQRAILGTGLVVACLLVGYAIATLWLSPASANADDGSIVQVPDVVGEPDAEARRLIEGIGLEYTVRRGLAHRDAPEGTVLAQSPLAGQFARPGAPVDVTLSRGPEVHTLPDVAGLSERQAGIVLERLGYDVEIERRADPMAAGRAVETRPAAGTDLAVPSPVVLVVSEGAPIVVIPDMLGMHIDDALQILSEVRLELGSISFDSEAPEAPGRIVGQYPPVGYSLRAGDSVELRVAGDPDRVNEGLDSRRERTRNGEPELL
ncbi:MAG: PASTA domain-containing protein [Gemmatimonadetes bacterium]|nr:MAG: PASTA domain-containing protein [Gemmatimonadota bacterium]